MSHIANETRSAMPADSDSLTFHPLRDAASERVYEVGDFMTWHARA
jgi:hypothetical protein